MLLASDFQLEEERHIFRSNGWKIEGCFQNEKYTGLEHERAEQTLKFNHMFSPNDVQDSCSKL